MDASILDTRATSQSCYSLLGNLSPFDALTYIPCNTTAVAAGQHSACCAPGDKCLTNGLCQYGQIKENVNEYWSVACTDKTWQDPACPKFCEQIPLDQTHQTHLVFQCPGDKEWCCATGHIEDFPGQGTTNTTCCSIEDLAFEDREAIVYTTASVHLQVLTSIASEKSVASSSLSTNEVTAVTTATAGPASETTSSVASTGSGPASLATASSLATTQNLASATPIATSSPSKSNNIGVAVGAGVGIPLIALLGVGIAFLLYRQKKRRNNQMHELGDDDVRHKNPQVYYHEAGDSQMISELQGTREVLEKDGHAWEMHDWKR